MFSHFVLCFFNYNNKKGVQTMFSILENPDLKNYKETLLKVFFENSYDGIFVTDKDQKLILANPSVVNLLKATPEDLLGNTLQAIMSKGYYDNSPALQSTKTKRIVTDIVRTPHGTEIISTSRPIFNESGELELVVTNCRPLNCIDKFYNSLNRKRAKNRVDKDDVENISKDLIFDSPIMQDMLKKLKLISASDSSTIIYGESGTGKSILAKYIHENSLRFNYPFVDINCAAIPESLIESELFGYEKGAFTGASSKGKLGLFEIADEGTIFLDEIAEMPLALQAKLLKILDTSYIRRVGGTTDHKVNVRIIAATNKNLKDLVQKKLFREDLYYRLNVVPIFLPPLRDRKEDISSLSDKFLKEFNSKYGCEKVFSPKTIKALLDYPWPGNIRELRNIIERLIITTTNPIIDIATLENSIYDDSFMMEKSNKNNTPLDSKLQGSLKEVLAKVENYYINKIINECNGSVTDAAKKLNIHRTLIYKKLNKYEDLSGDL